ncbi:beta-galactosidase GalB [Pelomonas sp. Root1444]|uniref:beta-galactosidase GalB n=1 Tax=Pelomonas sp. Root1444 TaxID=1736464 RepID=UPI0007025930|nr:beta-galactosidase GalB [Pelomonas sp. Root1444]KQY81694.1 beta-galactosidase [Pelomonas sp. Root1444]
MPRNPWRAAAGLALLLMAALPAAAQRLLPDRAHEQLSPRERIDLETGWRFQRGDPAGATARLMYDLRPEVVQSADGKVADAQPEEAQRAKGPRDGVLKPWVLPSANAFIKDPARRHVRPPGHPGGDLPIVQAGFDDSGWRAVTLPHDWAIEGPFLETGPYGGMGRLQTWGPVWYRRKLDITAADRGRAIFLDVDGAMSYATVWLNGKLVGGWPYGYTSFRLDLTPYVQPGGVNQLAIRLDNPPESARWYPGAGLYRKVWLTKTDPVHVAHWGTQVRTPQVSAEQATVALEVRVDNGGRSDARVDVATEFFALDVEGRRHGGAVARISRAGLVVPACGQRVAAGAARIAKPRLWGPRPQQQPHRYVAVTRVKRDGRVVDRYETRFGIRSLRFDPDTGLHVNGQPVRLNGVNNHHDLGVLGAAFNVRAAERQLEILQAMGANALRMAHNPPATELLELADRMGFLVVDEIFDSWERKKTPLDFHLVFPDWHEPDLRAMLRRDRNHPSVILWSIGNEVGEQYTGTDGAAVARRLHEIAREEDPTRPTTMAMNYAKSDMPLPAEVDVIGLNYQGEGIRQDPEFEGTDRIRTPPQYPLFHAKFPDKLILSSETASAFSSRGVYLFPVTPANSAITRDGRGGDSASRQVSAYELHAVDFGASADKVFAALDRHPYVAGEFVWTGFDYLGEPTPYYASRSSYSGIVDLAGFPKDRYWLYQSRWRPGLPMAHLLPHWTWPERVGQVTPVHAFTSGDEAELFLNGRSLGRRKKGPLEYRLRWDDVVYEPGELKLVAYRHGQPWATASVATAGEASQLALAADRADIAADGSDLSFVTVRIADAAGSTVPRAAPRVRFSVDGPGEIVATDNGDATSFEPFVATSRRTFSGQALVIVRGRRGEAGAFKLRAEADGLAPAELTLRSR